MIRLIHGSSPEALRDLDDNSVDSIVTDPPYGLSFMGKTWDYDVPSVDVWRECLRVLKPGGHLLAFAGTRTQHRMAVRIEDAGFEIRDMIAWVYGSGFPKSLDVSKAIDKRGGVSIGWFGPWFRKWREENGITQKQVAALFPSKTGGLTGCVANWELGLNLPTCAQFNLIRDTFGLPFQSIEAAERAVIGQQRGTTLAVAPGQGNDRSDTTLNITAPATDLARQWQGWGTALKPALEPITVARKPLIGTVVENVTTWGTGAINVDGGRVGTSKDVPGSFSNRNKADLGVGWGLKPLTEIVNANNPNIGRFPANLIHDGSDEVVGLFPVTTSGALRPYKENHENASSYQMARDKTYSAEANSGSAARFFYCAKASRSDREDGCDHLPARTAGEVTGGREEGSAGLDSPRAGAGRGTGSRNHHPTVKPTELMRYLCRLVTQPGGTVLDPFMGSGSTGRGAVLEGFRFIGVEREADYLEIARARIAAVAPEPEPDDVKPTTGQLALF